MAERDTYSLIPFHVWYRGQHVIVRARDRLHARIIAYAATWPESKWDEIRVS